MYRPSSEFFAIESQRAALLDDRDAVPRPVMIDYLKTVFGLHIAIYTLRLSSQLTGWIKDKKAHPTVRAHVRVLLAHIAATFCRLPLQTLVYGRYGRGL